jgi:hypothetical protein
MEVSGYLHAPASSSPIKILVPIGWAPEAVWMVFEKRKFLSPTGIHTPDHPACS